MTAITANICPVSVHNLYGNPPQDLSRLNFVFQCQCDSSAQIVLWEWEIWELWEELAAVEVTLETNG